MGMITASASRVIMEVEVLTTIASCGVLVGSLEQQDIRGKLRKRNEL